MDEVLHALEVELGEGLREFAEETDIDPSSNRPIFPITGKGRESTSFIRALEFTPSQGNRVAIALKAFEDGNTDPLRQIEEELREVGIGIRLRVSQLQEGRCIIDEIVLESSGSIHGRCGIEL